MTSETKNTYVLLLSDEELEERTEFQNFTYELNKVYLNRLIQNMKGSKNIIYFHKDLMKDYEDYIDTDLKQLFC